MSNDTKSQASKGKQTSNREALGHSRGGLTTKIHLAADHRCRPLTLVTSEGQRHDSVAFEVVMGAISVPRASRGRPRTRPDWTLADKAYGSRANRAYLARRGIKAAIPIKTDQAAAPTTQGQGGWTSAELRPRPVPGPQHRRARRQQAPSDPLRRHPLRQARLRLLRHHHGLSDPDLATRPRHHRIAKHALVPGSGDSKGVVPI